MLEDDFFLCWTCQNAHNVGDNVLLMQTRLLQLTKKLAYYMHPEYILNFLSISHLRKLSLAILEI